MQSAKRLLFVCVENSNRSQMAEAFARIHGDEAIDAYSAGSRPSGKINPKAIETMKEIGYDLSQHHSKSLTEIPDIEFDFVATMGCGDECPFVRAKRREDWDIPDPKDMPPKEFRFVRDLIERKVKDTLTLLTSEPKRWDLDKIQATALQDGELTEAGLLEWSQQLDSEDDPGR